MRRLLQKRPLYALAAVLLCALCLGGYLTFVGQSGGNAWDALRVVAVVCLAVILPGAMCARLLQAQRRGVFAAATLTCGTAVLAVCTLAATGLRMPLAAVGFYLIILAALCLLVRRTGVLFPAGGTGISHIPMLALLCCGLTLAYAFAGVVRYAHPQAVGAVVPDHDFFWNVGNANSFLLGLPPQDLRVSGVTLTYHYLTEFLAAGISLLTGFLGAGRVSCYDILAFYLSPLVLTTLVWVVWELGGQWFGSGTGKAANERGMRKSTLLRWGLLASVFLLGGAELWKALPLGTSPFWSMGVRHTLTNINSVATSTLFLAAFATLFVSIMQTEFSVECRADCALALGAFVLLCFAKGPVAGLVALAVACTVLLLAVRRDAAGRPRVRMLLFGAAVGGIFLLLYSLLFSAGAGSSIRFSLSGTLEKSYFSNYLALLKTASPALWTLCLPLMMLVQAVCMSPAAVPLFVCGALGDVPRLVRATLSGRRLFATAMAAGGLLAFFLFDHIAMSQMYFAFAGLFFAALLALHNLSAVGTWLMRRKKWLRCGAYTVGLVLLSVSVLTGVCTYAYFLRSGTQLARNRAAVVAAQESRVPLTAGEEEAMAVLRETMGQDAVFVTNRIHTGTALEGLSNVYSGLSGRRAYLEGFQYAVSNMGLELEEVVRRVGVVQTLFSAEITPRAAAQLCADEGISYLVYSLVAPPYDAAEGGESAVSRKEFMQDEAFTLVFENADVRILRLADP